MKYYAKGWKWFEFDPKESNSSEFKKLAMRQLGALNVIDNTKPIPIFSAKPGDLIMSRWSSTSEHTRIIYSVTQTKDNKFNVVWYQGNLPAVIPQKKTSMFSNISGVHESKPRRWNFDQFNT